MMETKAAACSKMTNEDVADLIKRAEAAGTKAGLEVTPLPMRIAGYAPVMDGPCGFAWVNVRPATGQIAKALVAKGVARKDSYYGGVTVWIHEYNQSMTRKAAHAEAFAEVLKEAGIDARAMSRLD